MKDKKQIGMKFVTKNGGKFWKKEKFGFQEVCIKITAKKKKLPLPVKTCASNNGIHQFQIVNDVLTNQLCSCGSECNYWAVSGKHNVSKTDKRVNVERIAG